MFFPSSPEPRPLNLSSARPALIAQQPAHVTRHNRAVVTKTARARSMSRQSSQEEEEEEEPAEATQASSSELAFLPHPMLIGVSLSFRFGCDSAAGGSSVQLPPATFVPGSSEAPNGQDARQETRS